MYLIVSMTILTLISKKMFNMHNLSFLSRKYILPLVLKSISATKYKIDGKEVTILPGFLSVGYAIDNNIIH